jgi:hypothetical protein
VWGGVGSVGIKLKSNHHKSSHPFSIFPHPLFPLNEE